MIRPANLSDANAIADIYNHFIANTCITFEEELITPDIISGRIDEVKANQLPWIVAEFEGAIVGYAYANTFHKRSAFRHTVETTIYLKEGLEGRGFGKLLYEVLLLSLKEKGCHAAIGSIALPNANSIALHEKLGFVQVGHFTEVGFKFNRWLDVGYWQKIF